MIWDLFVGFLKYQFAGLWPLLWHFGLGGVVVIVCVTLYIIEPAWLSKLSPRIHKVLLWVASVTAAAMIFTAIGVSLGERRIQAQWDQAKANTVDKVKKARAGAIRDGDRKPSRWVPNNRRDPDLRD